jgi:hypothetical protein
MRQCKMNSHGAKMFRGVKKTKQNLERGIYFNIILNYLPPQVVTLGVLTESIGGDSFYNIY